mgnify:FL=1|tara:strand:+ start:402 stop:851 length:450 start_codon:yes stop_codon:yes gene_type:complete
MVRKQRKKLSKTKKPLGKFKSSIEKYCSDALRENGIPFSYEEETFVLMESFRFPHRYLKMTTKKPDMSDRSDSIQQPIRYTPDFMGKGSKWVIETKGYLPSHHDFPMRWKLFLKHIVDNALGYDVYLAKNQKQVNQAILSIKERMQDER